MPKSYERQCHAVTEETGDRQFMLSLKSGLAEDLRGFHHGFPCWSWREKSTSLVSNPYAKHK